MSGVHVVYVAPYYSEEISAARRNRSYRSPAGLNKMQGVTSALEASGATVTVVSPVLFGQKSFRFFGSARERLGASEVIYPGTFDAPVLGILCSIFSTFAALWRLNRDGKAQRILFYNYLLATAVPAFLAKIFLGIPIAVEYEDGLYADPDVPRTKRLISLILDSIGRLLVTGGVLVSGTLASRLATDNACVCRGFYRAVPEAGTGAKTGSGSTILYSGRFDEPRGIDIFLEAAGRLTRPATVVITGYGPLEGWVRERAAAIDNVAVTVHGFLSRDEFRQVLGSADILVNPQRCRHAFGLASFPSKVYEYMSTGKVVVSSRVADVEEIAEGRLVLYDGDSPEALAQTLDRVLSDMERYRVYGESGRQWIAAHCTPEACGREIRDVLERA